MGAEALLKLRGGEGELAVSLGTADDPAALAEGRSPADGVSRWQDRFGGLLARPDQPLAAGALVEAGLQLAAIIPPSVRDCLLALVEGAGALSQLRVDASEPDCAALPWELMCLDLRSRGPTFLARDLGVPVIRGAVNHPQPPRHEGPLTVLLAWADPSSARYGSLVHTEREARAVSAVLRSLGGHVQVDELPYSSPVTLRRRLAARRPDVLHFIGHGDRRPTGGVLVLHGEAAGGEHLLYGEELAAWPECRSLRLAYLSSCETAGPGSVADCLAAVCPAVLGMQAPVQDAWASELAAVFYSSLARSGDVSEALARARAAGDPSQAGWVAPVLRLSVPHSRLLPEGGHTASAVARTNLPYRRARDFVGREADLDRLHAWLTAEEGAAVAILGLGGVGKTQLAVEYAHRYRRCYPGGVFWVSAQDEARFLEDYASLGRFWSVPEEVAIRRRAERVRDALHQTEEACLLVVDSVGDGLPLELLPAVGGCRLLFTARQTHGLPEMNRLFPGRLTPREALQLLIPEEPLDEHEQAAAREIVELLDGLPLALSLARHHLRRLDVSVAQYRDRLAGNRVAVLEEARRRFLTGTGHDGAIFDAIDVSSRSLSAPARELLRTASCFASRHISTDLLRQAGMVPDPADFDEALSELREACLVAREERGRIGVHELVRVYSLGQLPEVERAAVVARTAGVLLRELSEANRKLDWRGVRGELGHCRTAAGLCSENHVPLLPDLETELGHCAFHHREWDAAAAYFRSALKHRSDEGDNATAETTLLTMHLGLVEQHRGQHAEAMNLVEESLRRAALTFSPDDPRFGDLFNSRGYVLKMQGRLDEAEPWYRRALEFNRSVLGPRHPEVASCLNNLGALQEARENFAEARHLYEEALALDQEVFGAGHVKVAIRSNNLGRVLMRMERPAEASTQHAQALSVYEEAYGRQHVNAAMSLVYLGDAHVACNQLEEARACYAEALPTLQRHYGPTAPICQRVGEILKTL